ncbi:type II toxin-antitoxin system toxin TscT, partial [Staphylococcus haemolyticus]
QHIDLLSMYLKELDTVLEDIEKASSAKFGDGTDNA